ncbi:MAG: pyridoxamine 5'-phosphate oxidase family protein [Chloroflexi bacterium]|nr:pyridoxamine 5'-phosphate oxidase family protein [Chloroflexota bacterium]
MESKSQTTLARIIRTQRVAALGTLRDSAPFVSLVLFAASTDFIVYYIHVSRLAHHTQDLARDPRVSLMIAERDDDARDPQQLARVSILGHAAMLAPEDAEYASARAAYLTRHPENQFLFEFKDFALWRIEAQSARYVAGFAQAFTLNADDLRRVAQSGRE